MKRGLKFFAALIAIYALGGSCSVFAQGRTIDQPQTTRVVAGTVSTLGQGEGCAPGDITTPGCVPSHAHDNDPPGCMQEGGAGPCLKSGDELPVYCVREGGIPHNTQTEDEFDPDCVWVDHIEDVPAGVIWLPSHGGLDDPQAIRLYWCLDGSEMTKAMEAECQRKFGNRTAIKPPKNVASPVQTEPIVLELPALRIVLNP